MFIKSGWDKYDLITSLRPFLSNKISNFRNEWNPLPNIENLAGISEPLVPHIGQNKSTYSISHQFI